MKLPTIYAVLLTVILSVTQVSALPPQAIVESGVTSLVIDLADGHAALKSIANKETGETTAFAPESSDFELTTDQGVLKRTDFKVTDVISEGRGAYVLMDGEKAAVTERYEVFDSGCVKRSLQVFAKAPIYIEKVSLVNLKLNERPARIIQHNARFFAAGKGGWFVTAEMPMPARAMNLSKENVLWTEYTPGQQLQAGESAETVPAVFRAWTGEMSDGYEAYRDYTYELSGWRKHATVRTSSESPPALTTAYDGYKAVDDDTTTRWRADKGLGGTHWLEIEFPSPVTFNTMVVLFDNEDARPALEKPVPFAQYHVQVWADEGWKDIATGEDPPSGPVRFADTLAGKVRFLVDGCFGRFSLFDFRLHRDLGKANIISENLCSRFSVDQGTRMPFTYFNTWYISHPGTGRLQRARGLLTYQTVLPQIPLAAQCGIDNFVLDSGWKYAWSGVGINPGWPVEFYDGERPFVEAADRAGINLAAWFYFFWLEGDKYDHQWRVVRKDGKYERAMCFLSGYYDFVKTEFLNQIRNSHMKVMKVDGFVPSEECWATNHNHKPGATGDAAWLAFMRMVQEIKKQYPDFRIGPYTWDGSWVKYSELIHTYQDHGGLTAGELAPTRAKANYMHDREMFNEAYWRYLVRNQIEGSALIQDKTADWKEEVIGNLAGPTRRQISTDLLSFSADERNWIRSCMNWSRKNANYLEQFKPFFPNPVVMEPWGLHRNRGMEKQLGVDVLECNTLEGYAHISRDEGYIFIFNPTFHGADYAIPISEDLGFTSGAKDLVFQVIYPYLEDIVPDGKRVFAYGETVKGYLPAEKHVVIKVTHQPIPLLAGNCRYTVNETIYDSVNLTLRAAPTAKGGVVRTRLVPPSGVVFGELTANGKSVSPAKDGAYEFTLQSPVTGAIIVDRKPARKKNGKVTTTARVSISGDLLQPSLMLFLYRAGQSDREKLPKAESGQMEYRLLVDGKRLEGAYGDTFEKDWETEKNAGWWVFKLPANRRRFTVTVECTDKVTPVLLLSAKQDHKEISIIGKYDRNSNKGVISKGDEETFFHTVFPDETEYFPIFDLNKS
ncbi:MAG: discoidin domain-containing protein [Armatimonadota bacterium]|nr:discoidin domain-containing protein [Armatimonadota bacterium]